MSAEGGAVHFEQSAMEVRVIKLILCDDHGLVRAGLRRVLEDTPGMEVIAEAGTGEEVIELVRTHTPDIILMDVNMPGIGGLEATRRILQRYPEVRIIAISMYVDEPYPSRLLSLGARGYLSKDSAADEVVTAIRRVADGGVYIAACIANNLAAALVKGGDADKSPFERLSQREMQVMVMVTKGHSNQEISDSLCLSPKTVSTYRYRLFEKLDVTNDVELTLKAMRYGLLDDVE